LATGAAADKLCVQKITHNLMIRINIFRFDQIMAVQRLPPLRDSLKVGDYKIQHAAGEFHHEARTIGPDPERRVRRL
jgi:hypothetical protein